VDGARSRNREEGIKLLRASQEQMARVVARFPSRTRGPVADGRLPPDAEAGAGALVAAINGAAVCPKAAIVISIADTGVRAR